MSTSAIRPDSNDIFLAQIDALSQPTFLTRATAMLERGIAIIPLLPKSKNPCTQHAASDATTDPTQVLAWAHCFPAESNCGAVANKNHWFADDDGGTLAKEYKTNTGLDFPLTFTVKTSRGFHYYFLHDDASRQVRYGNKVNSGVIDTRVFKGEARCNNQYVVAANSIHPSGSVYEIVNDVPIIAAPPQLLDWLQQAYVLSESLKPTKDKPKHCNEDGRVDSGFKRLFEAVGYRPLMKRNNRLRDRGLKPGSCVPCPMPQHKHADFSDCFGPLEGTPELLHCLGNCGWTGDMVAAVYELDGGSATYKNMYECARAICKEERLNFEDFFAPINAPSAPHLADTEEWTDEPSGQEKDLKENISEMNDDSEVSLELAVPEDAALRPKLSQEALYGLAGDIVRKIIPQTESHPAGLLVQTLMYFGNVIGKTAYFQVESDKHFGNIFAVRVGDSSKGRKGTGAGRINAVFENVDPYWFAERRGSGLSSGEGLVASVQDAVYAPDKKTGGMQLVNNGVKDKRFQVYEGEFGQVLAVMQRQGATLSPIIRNAWDGQKLQISTIVQRVSTGHHISIQGDITSSELKKMLTHQDAENGFANRFLWVHTERTKLLPFGGEELDFTVEVERLQAAIAFAKRQRRIFMDDAARKVWHRAYPKLAVAHDGLFGKIVSRGEPQVLRLSMLFALLDCSEHIRPEHLRAGLAVWKYSENSARYVFDALTEDQKTLLEFLKENGTQTATGIYKNLYSKNRKAEIIKGDLNALIRHKMAGRRKNGKGVEEFRAL